MIVIRVYFNCEVNVCKKQGTSVGYEVTETGKGPGTLYTPLTARAVDFSLYN